MVHTSKQAKGGFRLLIVDGHDSDVNMELIEFCLVPNIIAYRLPSTKHISYNHSMLPC